ASTQAVSFVPMQGSAIMNATIQVLLSEHTYSLRVLRRSRSLLEHLPIPDSVFSRMASQLKVLRQFECIHRTGILTEPTEHAARNVVGKSRQVLAVGLLVAQAGYHNQVFRTGQRA